MLKIALSKGRILDQTLPLLEKAGITINIFGARAPALNRLSDVFVGNAVAIANIHGALPNSF